NAGTAAEHSRLVAAASRFGPSDEIKSAVITPDSSTMYFTTNRTGHRYDNGWQLRAADVSTGRLRVVGRYAGLAVFLTADPSVGRILAAVEFRPPVPSPTGVSPALRVGEWGRDSSCRIVRRYLRSAGHGNSLRNRSRLQGTGGVLGRLARCRWLGVCRLPASRCRLVARFVSRSVEVFVRRAVLAGHVARQHHGTALS